MGESSTTMVVARMGLGRISPYVDEDGESSLNGEFSIPSLVEEIEFCFLLKDEDTSDLTSN